MYISKKVFKKGDVLTVDYTIVHSSTTDVYFKETGNNVCFNSVMFAKKEKNA
jgi:hypothetical protein